MRPNEQPAAWRRRAWAQGGHVVVGMWNRSVGEVAADIEAAARSAATIDGIEAIGKALRVHSGEDFTADEFPTFEEGREAWETWKQITRHGYVPGESAKEIV